MQLTTTFFPNSAIFVEKKWVENRLWGESAFLWGGESIILRGLGAAAAKLTARLILLVGKDNLYSAGGAQP